MASIKVVEGSGMDALVHHVDDGLAFSVVEEEVVSGVDDMVIAADEVVGDIHVTSAMDDIQMPLTPDPTPPETRPQVQHVTLATKPTVSTVTTVIPASSLTTLSSSPMGPKVLVIQQPQAPMKTLTPLSRPLTLQQIGTRPVMTTTIANSGSAMKRPFPGKPGQVITKFIITGSPTTGQPNPQPVILATSQSGDAASSGIKIISGHPSGTIMSSSGKPITLAPGTKLQTVSSPSTSSAGKPVIISKVVSPLKAPTRFTVIPSVMKTPTKILPAPISTVSTTTSPGQKPGIAVVPTSALKAAGTSTSGGQPRFIIRPSTVQATQGTLKSGLTLQGTTHRQVIRLATPQQAQHITGRQFQYVRLVTATQSTTATSGGTVTTTAKQTQVIPVSPKIIPITSTASGSQGGSTTLGTTVKVVPIAPNTQGTRMVSTKLGTVSQTQRILVPANAMAQLRPASVPSSSGATPSATVASALPAGATILSSGASGSAGSSSNIVVVPAQFASSATTGSTGTVANIMSTAKSQTSLLVSQSRNAASASGSSPQMKLEANGGPPIPIVRPSPVPAAMTRTIMEPNGLRPRKPCNCTKSQCLKLYCDCFANGEFCNLCNCANCYNNLVHEEERQKAIKACLDRNPNAFRPKIGKGLGADRERRHNKGCNCKRSGCLKNYCECYEAKIPCSAMCKCMGCKNFEDAIDQKSLRDLADAAEVRVLQQNLAKTKLSAHIQDIAFRPPMPLMTGTKPPSMFVTGDVVEATCQCLLARAEEMERHSASFKDMFNQVLEEFGQCLVQVVQSSNKSDHE